MRTGWRWVWRGIAALALPLLTTCAPPDAVLGGVTAAVVVPSMGAAPAPPIEAAPEPVRLSIPAIGVDSHLVRLGLDAEGGMEVPVDVGLAGWYRHGARPGTPGPLVVAGHVDSRTGPAVFHRLRELDAGDLVEVRTAAGPVTYRVHDVARYPKAALPTFAVFGHTPDHVLRLVTCDGVFDADRRSYRDNLVVSATPVAP